MHDPSFLIFDVPTIRLDVWHDEPEGRDAFTVCGHPPMAGGQNLTWRRLRWAFRHRHHLHYRFWPYLRIKRWMVDRCDLCGERFHWRSARFSYMSTDKVWHQYCSAWRHASNQRDEAWAYLENPGSMDPTAKWRVEYALQNRRDAADKEKGA